MSQPNFFIIGAPKSGTTALAQYLREHPNVFFSEPKEPHYWCSDLRRSGTLPDWVESRDRYFSLFRKATNDHLAVGEGSTNYISSESAIGEIREFNPDARFIAMLRNPVELVKSLHQHELYMGVEGEPDFERAWELQAARAEGRQIPATCKCPLLLQYMPRASHGANLARLYSIVPRENVLIILFDDFKSNPRQCYESTLAFLGLPLDGRTEFPIVGQARSHGFPRLVKLVRDPPALLSPVLRSARFVGRRLGAQKLWYKMLEAASTAPVKKELKPSLRSRIANDFRADVELLSDFLNHDLSHWLS